MGSKGKTICSREGLTDYEQNLFPSLAVFSAAVVAVRFSAVLTSGPSWLWLSDPVRGSAAGPEGLAPA